MKIVDMYLFVHCVRSALNQVRMGSAYKDKHRRIYSLHQVAATLRQFGSLCRETDLRITCKTIQRAEEELNSQLAGAIDFDVIEREIQQILQCLEDELELRTSFWLEPDEATAWTSEKVFGEQVSLAFPSTDFELEEFSKCLALGRYTAAVFHLVRALEIGLNALSIGIVSDRNNTNWATLIDQVAARLNSHVESEKKSTVEDPSDLIAHLHNVRRALRNHDMPLRQRYDKERAEEVFVHVRAVMKVLSKDFQESPIDEPHP